MEQKDLKKVLKEIFQKLKDLREVIEEEKENLEELKEGIEKATGLKLYFVEPFSSLPSTLLFRISYPDRYFVFVNPKEIEFRIVQGDLAAYLKDYHIMAEKVTKKFGIRTLITFGDEYRRKGVICSFKEMENEVGR